MTTPRFLVIAESERSGIEYVLPHERRWLMPYWVRMTCPSRNWYRRYEP